jgi:hypothetical protein
MKKQMLRSLVMAGVLLMTGGASLAAGLRCEVSDP